MIEQMKKMRLNRTALLAAGLNTKPSSVLALTNDGKKVLNSSFNKNSGSQPGEDLVSRVSKNKLRMK